MDLGPAWMLAPPFPDCRGQGGVCSPGTMGSIERWKGLFCLPITVPHSEHVPKARYSVTTENRSSTAL